MRTESMMMKSSLVEVGGLDFSCWDSESGHHTGSDVVVVVTVFSLTPATLSEAVWLRSRIEAGIVTLNIVT